MNDLTASAGPSSSISASLTSLAAYREAYKRADDFCKEVQSFVEEAGIPAINEMRYAGYHLLEAIDVNGFVSGPHLTKAVNHANRACYEAGEAGILCALDHISRFKTAYKDVVVSNVVRNWLEILGSADQAIDRVKAEREHGEDRAGDFCDFLGMFRTLKAHCRTLDQARDDLNKLLSKDRRETRRFIVGTFIAFAILVGTIAAAWYGYSAFKEARLHMTSALPSGPSNTPARFRTQTTAPSSVS